MMNIYLITDTHFNHPEIGELCNRPEGWEKKIIDNWKMMVRPEDTIIHLGDVMLCDHKTYKESFAKLINALPGKKVLVRGNHDKQSDHWYMENGFVFCCSQFVMGDVVFSHCPAVEMSKIGMPSGELPKEVKYNIHGHIHTAGLVLRKPLHRYSETRFLLSLEANNYRPIKFNDVQSQMPQMKIVKIEGGDNEDSMHK